MRGKDTLESCRSDEQTPSALCSGWNARATRSPPGEPGTEWAKFEHEHEHEKRKNIPITKAAPRTRTQSALADGTRTRTRKNAHGPPPFASPFAASRLRVRPNRLQLTVHRPNDRPHPEQLSATELPAVRAHIEHEHEHEKHKKLISYSYSVRPRGRYSYSYSKKRPWPTTLCVSLRGFAASHEPNCLDSTRIVMVSLQSKTQTPHTCAPQLPHPRTPLRPLAKPKTENRKPKTENRKPKTDH